MLRSLLLSSLLAVTALAHAQHLPLQPLHSGVWGDAVHTGEGLDLQVLEMAPHQPLLLVAYVYTYDPDGRPLWLFVNEQVRHRPPYRLGVYVFDAYRTRYAGAGPPDGDRVGTLVIKTDPDDPERLEIAVGAGLSVPGPDGSTVIEVIDRHWYARQLTRPQPLDPDFIVCPVRFGFGPHRPADELYCRF